MTSTVQAAVALAKKDVLCFVRDRTALAFNLLVPLALVTVFGWIMAFAFGGSSAMPKVKLHIADLSQTDKSAGFVKALSKSEMLNVQIVDLEDETEDDRSLSGQVKQMVADGEAHHVLVIQPGFDELVDAGKTPELEMFRDPGRSMEDRVVQLSIMQTAMSELGGNMFTNAMDRMLTEEGMDEGSVGEIRNKMDEIGISIEDFFDDKESTEGAAGDAAAEPAGDDQPDPSEADDFGGMDGMLQFMQEAVPVTTTDVAPPNRPKQATYQQAQSVAGMTVMMLLFALTGCGSVLLTEREEGTLKRLFAQPVSRNAILLGKFLFVFTIGVLQITILFVYGELMFGVGLFNDPVTLVVLSLAWVITGGAFGMFLASACSSTKQAESLASLLILVMAALGGCWFPLQLMSLPPALEMICKSTPTYWAMTGFQGMLWNQLPWYSSKMLTALAWQGGWTVLLGTASIYLFRRNFCRG